MEFTVQGKRVSITADQVVAAMRDVEPEPITEWAAQVAGVTYPVKQAFSVATGLGRQEFIATTAREKLEKLGFSVFAVADRDMVAELSDGLVPGSREQVLTDAFRSFELAAFLPGPQASWYQSIVLALIDSIFVGGAKYASTQRVVENFLTWWHAEVSEGSWLTTSDFSKALGLLAHAPEDEAREIAKAAFGNLSRVEGGSTLKAVVVAQAVELLLEFGVDSMNDLLAVEEATELERAFRSLPGQASGASLKYLRYLATGPFFGVDQYTLDVVGRLVGGPVSDVETRQLLRAAASQLSEEGLSVDTPDLVRALWRAGAGSGALTTISAKAAATRKSKYEPLERHLRLVRDDQVTMSFQQIESIIGASLPPSARKHPAFWANHDGGTHVWANAWMAAGWRVIGHDVSAERVTFMRASHIR